MTQGPRIRILSSRTIQFNPIRPVYFMHTPDITSEERALALETLEEILDIANVRRQIPVTDFGVWREPNYRDSNGQLVPHMSVDWYVNRWYNPQRRKVAVDEGARQLLFDPWNDRQPHYDVILTAQYLYTPDTNFVVGVAHPRRGTITSVNRFRNVSDGRMQRETKKQELYHEVGHVLGLPNESRGVDLEYSLGAHCINPCAVRQGLRVPSDWINFVRDRDRTGQVYCDTCIKDLRTYFGR